MKTIKKVLLMLLIFYLFLNIFLFFNQKNMLYFPDKTDFYNCSNFTKEEKEYYEDVPYLKEDFKINRVKFYEVKGEKNNLIVFFHGNAGRACDRKSILENLRKTGNSIIFVEYDGYADNKSPDIKHILKNVDAIGNYIKNEKKFDKVFVMGRSLGTGPASYFAGKYKTDKLLLVSPYDELYKVAQKKYSIFPVKYLFTENYNSKKYLENYKNDLLIFHGKKDKVIPYIHGLDLFKSLKNKNKKMISLENANHHNVFSKEVKRKIVEYFE